MNELQDDSQPDQTPPTAAPSTSWFRAYRNSDGMELWMKHRPAFFLLYLIAYRAQWSDRFNRHDLKPGQCLLGDVDNIGLTTQEYRTAKKILQDARFATFKPTRRGTIATLVNTGIFDHFPIVPNRLSNQQPTNSQQAANQQPTTTQTVQPVQKDRPHTDVGRSAAASPASRVLSQDQWLAELKNDPAYAGIEVDREFAKMNRWCEVHKKQGTRRRFINWLNRCDKKMQPASQTQHHSGKDETENFINQKF